MAVTESLTHVACLTPPGTGAIATLGLRGPRAWDVVRRLFRPRSSGPALPAEPEPGRVWLGRLGDGLSDQVVVTVPLPLAAAGGPWVEVHCHGGREVVRLLLDTFGAHGVSRCSWQELERRTAGRPLKALAAAALAEAGTVRTAAILLDQYQGALEQALTAVLAALDRDDPAEAGRLLAELEGRAALGRHLTAPWRVIVAGAPNVGKSSLVNALAGYQRSVVAATPGTTRDVVTAALAVEGWPVELTDTAGLRTDAGPLEEEGIRRAEAALASADLCLWVLDASAPPAWPRAPAGAVRLVVNKTDLPAAWDLGEAAGAVWVSARTGAGLPDLCRELGRWLVPNPPPPGAAVPFTPSLGARVAAARDVLAAGHPGDARREVKTALTGAEDGPRDCAGQTPPGELH
jgi:tRNA modification GTPase